MINLENTLKTSNWIAEFVKPLMNQLLHQDFINAQEAMDLLQGIEDLQALCKFTIQHRDTIRRAVNGG